MTHDKAVLELKQAVGPRGWLEGADAEAYEIDCRKVFHGKALLVVRPASTEEVAKVVTICRDHGIGIIPQGGNTGLCGGSVPVGDRPSLIISTLRMNRIVSIEPFRYAVTVEAGCTLQAVHDAAASVDRGFAMDWGARGSATIGGGIAANAGGLNVLRYGTTRDQVLGLEVVLPDGRIWNGLRALRKDASGYDLKQLFIGSEGTLGIVTKAVLKLYPRDEATQSCIAALPRLDVLNELFALGRAIAGTGLAAFELIPGFCYELALQKYPSLVRPLEGQADWYVLVRFAGRHGIDEDLLTFLEQASDAALIADASLAANVAQENNLWALRDEIPPSRLLGGKLLKWDASVPIDAIVPFLREAQLAVSAIRPDLRLTAFGHFGDGNLHLNVFPKEEPDDPGFDALGPDIQRTIDQLIWRFGGSICAEHGVGVENITRLIGQKPPIELEMMARLRTLFDPASAFNAGKLLKTN